MNDKFEIQYSSFGLTEEERLRIAGLAQLANTPTVLSTRRELSPDFAAIARLDSLGVVVTAPGRDCDFVSRCFFPSVGVDEDPVTGSAHCSLAPYWAKRLNRKRLSARQLSRRGGALHCEVQGDRVLLEGKAVDFLCGEIIL